MIASISGTIVEILPDGAVVDVHGVGYRLLMPSSVIASLPAVGKPVRAHTHLHVREDAMTLYGFSTIEQRDLFAVLLGVNGIGPKGALARDARFDMEGFKNALRIRAEMEGGNAEATPAKYLDPSYYQRALSGL